MAVFLVMILQRKPVPSEDSRKVSRNDILDMQTTAMEEAAKRSGDDFFQTMSKYFKGVLSTLTTAVDVREAIRATPSAEQFLFEATIKLAIEFNPGDVGKGSGEANSQVVVFESFLRDTNNDADLISNYFNTIHSELTNLSAGLDLTTEEGIAKFNDLLTSEVKQKIILHAEQQLKKR